MASQTRILITHDKEQTVDLKNQYLSAVDQSRQGAENLINLLSALATGNRMGSLSVTIDDGNGTSASGTVTFASLVNNDTVTVGGVVFTAKTSGATGTAQFNLGANDTAAAVAFAAAVLAHPTLAPLVLSVVPAAAVTTITANPGISGNAIGLAISAHGSVSGALLTGGASSTNPQNVIYKYGV